MDNRFLRFFLFLKLVPAIFGNNNSAIYFPTGEDFPESLQVSGLAPGIAPQNLAALRGTGIYEQYVDEIISSGIARLTVEINKLLVTRTSHSDNVLFSPMSITGVLALVLLGSNGATFKQISEFWGLHVRIPDIDKKSQIVHEQFGRIIKKINQTSGFEFGEEVNVASALFVQDGYPIRPIYRNTAEDLYQSSIVNVNFQSNPVEAQKLVNDWVSIRTNHKIKNILNDVPSRDTKVILSSALYFKAEWEQHFFEGLTKKRPFYINGKKAPANAQVDMMSNGGDFPYYKDPELGCEILGLPYKGNGSTMYVIMPFESSQQKLVEFERKITAAHLDRLVKRTKLTGAIILFPKMTIDTTIDLKDTLKSLGVTSLFDPHEANLALLSPGIVANRNNNNSSNESGINDLTSRLNAYQTIDNIRQMINSQSADNKYQNPGLFASQVIHKVYMDITEKGTEAAAATSVSLTRDGSRVTFRVDVPFCFFIRHDITNTILFWGSVVAPNPSYQVL